MILYNFKEQEELLERYGINRPLTFFVDNEKDFFSALENIDFPLVIKVFGKNILHRTEVGGVNTNINCKEDAFVSYKKMMEVNGAEGIIMQKKIEGFEFVVGAKNDAVFGTTIMLGTGGIMIEIFEDVSFRVAPIVKEDALKMISEIKGRALLEGFRGSPILDKNKLADLLVKASVLAFKEKIKEMDFNPVIINEENVFACDAKIIYEKENV